MEKDKKTKEEIQDTQIQAVNEQKKSWNKQK